MPLYVHPASHCDICLSEYDTEDVLPHGIPCGHILCKACFMHILEDRSQRFLSGGSCPLCRRVYRDAEAVKKLHVSFETPAPTSPPMGDEASQAGELTRRVVAALSEPLEGSTIPEAVASLENEVQEWLAEQDRRRVHLPDADTPRPTALLRNLLSALTNTMKTQRESCDLYFRTKTAESRSEAMERNASDMTEELEALRVRIAELESTVRRRKDVKGKGKAREVIPSPPLYQPVAISPFSLQAGGVLHYDADPNPLPMPPEDVTFRRTAFYPYTETGTLNNDPAIYGTRTIRQHVVPPMMTDSGAPGIIIKKERRRDPKEKKHRKKHRETYEVAPVAGPSEPRMAVQQEVDRSLQRASPIPESVPTTAVRAESPNTRRANFTPLSSRGSIATWNDNGSINVNFSSNSRLSLNSLGVDGLAHFQTEPLPMQTLDAESSPLRGSSDSSRRQHSAPEDGLEISVGDPRAFLPVTAPSSTTSVERTPTQPRARLTSRATAPAAPSSFHDSTPSSYVGPPGSHPSSLQHPTIFPETLAYIPERHGPPGRTHSHSSSRVSAPSRSSRHRSHEPQVNWGPHIYAAAPPTSRNNALGLEVTAQAPVVVAPTPNMPSGARHFLRSFSHAT